MYMLLKRGLSDFGTFIPTNENVFKYIKNRSQDYYSSIYHFTEDHKKKASEMIEIDGKQRPRGISGINDVRTNRIVFDFDSENDLEAARKDTIELCNRLFKHGLTSDDVNLCFSGMKGFSVELITDRQINPDDFKNIVRGLAGDLSTFDTKIYNPARVFRLPYTKHLQSKLYKTPLIYDDLVTCNIKFIMEQAAQPRDPNPDVDFVSCKLPDTIFNLRNALIAQPVVNNAQNTKNFKVKMDLDLVNKPKFLSNWKYALLKGYFPKGCRHYALMVLGATFKAQGFPEEVCEHMLIGASELQAKLFNNEPYSEDEIKRNVIGSIYSPLWSGGTYAEESFPDDLKQYLVSLDVPSEKSKADIFTNPGGMFEVFSDYARNIDKNTILTGITELDKKVRLTTGMMSIVVGAPSSGKTSFALEILRTSSIRNESCLFFSLDMSEPHVAQKLTQKVTGKRDEEIFRKIKANDSAFLKDMKDGLMENYGNMGCCFKTALSADDVGTAIEEYEKSSGKKLRLVVIDYLECLAMLNGDSLTSTSLTAMKLKDIAINYKVHVLLLAQPQKSDPSTPIISYTKVKGASTLAQSARVILGIYRDGFNPENSGDDKFITINVLKNNLGGLGSVDMKFDGMTGSFTPLDNTDKIVLKALRDAKLEAKTGEDLY